MDWPELGQGQLVGQKLENDFVACGDRLDDSPRNGASVAILAERCFKRELRHVPWSTLAEIRGIPRLLLTL
jgi:hypothetical protein